MWVAIETGLPMFLYCLCFPIFLKPSCVFLYCLLKCLSFLYFCKDLPVLINRRNCDLVVFTFVLMIDMEELI